MFSILPSLKSIRLLLIIVFVNGCLSLPAVAESANQILEKKVTVSFKEINLKSGIDKIAKAAEVSIIYSNSKELINSRVSLQAVNKQLKEVLNDLLLPFPLSYKVIDDKIIISHDAQKRKRTAEQQPVIIKGKVTDSIGMVLPGATLKIVGESKVYITDKNGDFVLSNVPLNARLQVSFIGFITQEVLLADTTAYLTVVLKQDNSKLNEVKVVSTGYQTLPKERATGSFVLIDSALLNRRVGSNILERLDGVTSGLIFNQRNLDGNNNSTITIRGRSTIFANPNPLIVVDNFPYDGDINSINPNDIESISILKDAAAASIWGVRAGNGVIVITTKKGKKGSDPVISLNANLTIGEKPNLNYPYQMSSADNIYVEKFLFDQGYYDNTISNGYSAISPAVALMDKLRNSQISQTDYDGQINTLKPSDVRNDLRKYFYRKSANQQYSLSVSGGAAHQKYFISAGFDKNLGNLVSDSYKRYTINANNTLNLLNDKLELFTSISFTRSNTGSNANTYRPYTAYDQLADKNGSPLPVVDNINQTLRASYVDTAGNGKLLDWRYFPLNENKGNRNTGLTNYRFLAGITYKLIDQLKIQVNYQYQQDQNEDNRVYNQDSFYARDLINRFSAIDPSTGTLSRIIPLGAITDRNDATASTQYGRAQLSYEKTIKNIHAVSAIAGFEVKDYQYDLNSQRYYGYDPSTASNANGSINPLAYYNIYYDPYGAQTIPTAPSQLGNTDRYRSYYANASYTYNSRYIFTASARKDETNIFGVKANQKGVPLWSAGLAWNLSNEGFYHSEALPYLKIRATYGYNGNADKTTSAYLTANAFYYNIWNTLYANIINPPNPSLGWEKIENINLGIDFSTKGNWLSGSFEYYRKRGMDLIGNSPIAPQTGVTTFKGNSADTKTNGIDIVANLNILSKPGFKWKLNLLYNYALDRIINYSAQQGVNGDIVFSNYSNPLVGFPYYAIFAFKSAGLDATGNPRGYLAGAISTDYAGIYNSQNADELVYKGPATPRSFGSIRNNISFRQWDLSVNVVYKLGYYFRKNGIFSGSNYGYNQGEFDQRWQKPGDELHTTIPSLIYPNDSYRDVFYLGSEDVIDKGDHIRLQDIRLSYQLNKKYHPYLPFKSLQIYSYINNVGILWRANKDGLDPDAGTQLLPSTRTISFGLNATF
ncbi:SusC/RagA family TonB-linked outer membrane protein [Mucilaginibacter sp. ZT4R22]|uniref:SusC/RagA family TonB-linked outer membrane protein n=1 Tax=Mucilaginibacter pankratovii TaxID=2772110 RepID=A0ABR7WJS9_9SPHI|nr:SusC/RagA family TonB-linked outer membrane protein [Mucilaginibacter pankratovii]MBD1362573.1 SusC/RagA family TonB-linked outer membrane protein [Mucilaginibacter pankratovii]